MMIKRNLLIIFILASGFSIYAQTKDFGIWYGGNVSYDLLKKVDVEVATSIRTIDNASHIDQFYLDGGISYKFSKYVSLSGNYRWILKNENWDSYYNRYRLYTDLKLTYPYKNFKLSARGRFQSQYKQYIEKAEDKLPDYYCRFKAQLSYNWPFFKLDPFVSAEWFYPLNTPVIRSVEQKRISAGVKYKINKKQSVEGEFMFQREYLPRLNDLGIISISYEYEF